MVCSAKQKGYRTVRKGREELEADGWYTESVEKTGKFVAQKDLFGLFDVVAIKPGRTKLIQYKTNRIEGVKITQQFSKDYPQFECEIWGWYNYKGWSKRCFIAGKKIEYKR